ncbi:MAG TPA: PIN domain-containing protein [Casimicrobiaceae bacterium]|jgi:predicted nucleic acid-binding protein
MSAADSFFDTNIVLYLLSADAVKADRAEQLIASGGQISVQVLNEVAAVARRKLAMSWREIREVIKHVRSVCHVTPLTIETHERGLQVAEHLGLSVYGGMIVASALLSGCAILYTEDLQAGQVIDRRLTIRNPFALG